MTKAEATDDNTLVLTYSAPVANVLSNLQQLSILPQHVWEQYAVGDGKALRQFPNEPTDQPLVSGGPFELAKYEKDQVAIFQRNPNFYGTKPAIDGFGLQYFSNDDSMVAALRNGQIQAAINVPVTAVESLKGDSSLTVYNGPGITLRDFIINSSPEKTTNLELQDPKVRMAMEYAIDRDTIVKTAWLGYAEPGSTIVAPGTGDWHDSQIQGLPFDIDKANTLLDQAGYAKGPDGIRVANGHPMSYTVLFASDETGAGDAAFRIIQNGFQQIGIEITQRKMDNDAVNSAILGDDNTYNQFDLAMWDWFPLIDPDFILSVLTKAQWGGWSDTGFDNPTYDKLYGEQGLAIDPAKRLQIVHQMQQIAFDERPVHHPELQPGDRRLVQRLGRVRRQRVRAGPVQQPLEGSVQRGPPSLRPSAGREEPDAPSGLRHQAPRVRDHDGVRGHHGELHPVPRAPRQRGVGVHPRPARLAGSSEPRSRTSSVWTSRSGSSTRST